MLDLTQSDVPLKSDDVPLGFRDVGSRNLWNGAPMAVVVGSRTGCSNIIHGKNFMESVFVFNDPPYGTERCYNALRLVNGLMKKDAEAGVTVFLMADAVIGARAGQKTPNGYYNIERMLKPALAGNGQVLLCATCMDARGLTDAEIMPGAKRSSMDALAAAVLEADKVLVF